MTSDRDRASSGRADVRLAAWALVLGSLAACERKASPPPSPPDAGTDAPTSAAASADEPSPATPPPLDPPPSTTASDDAQAERILDDYAAIEPFLRPRPEGSTLSLADSKRVSALLGDEHFDWGETDGSLASVRMAWLASMSAAVARGEPPSTLRIPLQATKGWGCEIPSDWIATGEGDAYATFIVPVGGVELRDACKHCYAITDAAERERCHAQRCNLQAQGSFTGKTIARTDYCKHVGHEFRIERLAVVEPSAAPFTLALPGGAAPPEGPPIADGPRWGVLLTSAVRHEKGARARADALRERLVEKGHAKSEVLDSRRISTLWCCSFAVLVERFDSEKPAKALAKRLKQEGFDGALVQALY